MYSALRFPHGINIDRVTTLTGVWPEKYQASLFKMTQPHVLQGSGVKDRNSALALLASGRVDYLLDVERMLKRAVTAAAQLSSDGQWQFADLYPPVHLYFRFADSDDGRAIKALFDRKFTELALQGKLAPLYEKYRLRRPDIL